MAEHGFYQFYHSILEFEMKETAGTVYLDMGIDKDEIDLEPITIEQMKKPIIIFLCLNGIAVILLIIEILVFKWLKWRNCKQSILYLWN